MVAKTIVFLGLATTVQAFNRPECASWPSSDVWMTELGGNLSDPALLHSGISPTAYESDCEGLGTDAFAISKAGNGICMHAHACQYMFCDGKAGSNLPSYTIEAKSVEDVQATMQFATKYDIPVSIKTTGHSYQSQSMQRESLMLWMQNYAKDGTITKNFEDTCGTVHDAVVGIGGGEIWQDVFESVGEGYHIVTGAARTVSAVGGWLQGCGLSFSSRTYGIGIDQAIAFDVVLADGSLVKADACTNEGLFWALRGGGGGNYGVVVHAEYRLHPVTPITVMVIELGGLGYLVENELFDDLLLYIGQF